MTNSESDRLVGSPYPPPSRPPTSPPIHIKHPYHDHPMFTFPRLDEGGVHHATAWAACSVIDDNRWTGYLSLDKEGEHRILHAQKILRAPQYYYQTSPQKRGSNYAVIPTFSEWAFPTKGPPHWWNETVASNQSSAQDDDSLCRATQCEDDMEDTHLIPMAERRWFSKYMWTYSATKIRDKMQDPDNSVRLGGDLRAALDAKMFTVVPMKSRWVGYCMNADPDSELTRLHHGVELPRMRDLGFHTHFLYARFAYTVFEHFRAFLRSDSSKLLYLRIDQNATLQYYCDPEGCGERAEGTAVQVASPEPVGSPILGLRRRDPNNPNDAVLDDDEMWFHEYLELKRGRAAEKSSIEDKKSKIEDEEPEYEEIKFEDAETEYEEIKYEDEDKDEDEYEEINDEEIRDAQVYEETSSIIAGISRRLGLKQAAELSCW
ncbi:hypothetical protein AYO20_09413 [Fonsecaea nubica]|uniref:HNH nuclease domain-containing protein n=1 Tax=Fonsecaea nubica TaxID=856822 RepID=A0A178CFD3_9EURO|nr:hypothetical protein AYO20_09413 [Fonsecaea nubica]OAL28689.1 hypothetical protein AYO20_09413 [Fonsecaea nubica]